MNLAERLKVARESIGKSQKEIADMVGVSYRAWQGYETGENVPGGKVFEALVRLGFSGTWLLTGEGEMRNGQQRDYLSTPEGVAFDVPLLEAAIAFVEIYEQLLDDIRFPPSRKSEDVFKMCKRWATDGTYAVGDSARDILAKLEVRSKVGIKDAYEDLENDYRIKKGCN